MSESTLKVNTALTAACTVLMLILIGLGGWFGTTLIGHSQTLVGIQVTVDKIDRQTMPRAEIELELAEIRRDQQREDSEHQKTEAYIVELRARVNDLERKTGK